MASGVFDIIHTGHISYLEQARAMGDELVVVVASDSTVRRKRHEPITPGTMRVRIIGSLKPVTEAVLGNDGDMFSILRDIRPDVIVLGYDQEFDEKELESDLREKGFDIRVRRAERCSEDLAGTRRIIDRIVDEYGGGG